MKRDAAQGIDAGALVAEIESVLTCRAQHPANKRGASEYADRLHGREIIRLPLYVVPTGVVTDDPDHVRVGCIGAKCPSDDCRMITEYRIAKPPAWMVRKRAAPNREKASADADEPALRGLRPPGQGGA